MDKQDSIKLLITVIFLIAIKKKCLTALLTHN